MVGAGGHVLPGGGRAHLGGYRTSGARGAVAELAIRVIAPGPERAVGAHGHRVAVAPGGHALPGGGRAHLGGHTASGRGTVAELAVTVKAPGPKGAVGAHGHRVVARGGHALPGSGRAHLGGHTASGRSAVAELAVRVIAPGPERAVDAHGHRVVGASGHTLGLRGGQSQSQAQQHEQAAREGQQRGLGTWRRSCQQERGVYHGQPSQKGGKEN